MNKSLLSLALMTALTGCSLIPDYQRPDAPVAGDWPQGEAYQQSAAQASEQTLGWREFFRDPALQQLVQVALENNRDLRVAALNVEAYRALYRIQRADLLHSVSADGAAYTLSGKFGVSADQAPALLLATRQADAPARAAQDDPRIAELEARVAALEERLSRLESGQ